MAPERDEAEIDLPMDEDTEQAEAAAGRQPVEPVQEPEEDEYEEPEEENVGQWSPRPLEPEHVVGQDVIPEEEDARLLDLLRKKVGALLCPCSALHACVRLDVMSIALSA